MAEPSIEHGRIKPSQWTLIKFNKDLNKRKLANVSTFG